MVGGIHCGELLEELSDYIDGAAGQELCDQIETHLANCPDCEILINTMRKTIVLYSSRAGTDPLPDAVRQRLYKALNLREYLDG